MKITVLPAAALCLAALLGPAAPAARGGEPYSAYLMAYFGPQEKLFYAWSRDARNWTALNGGRPVFDAHARLRDPFIRRVNGRFHLVHTKGWDHPTIFHWESTDLVDWKGGPIDVVPPDRKRAWAPEFFYEAKTGLFHVFWASILNGHNTLHVVTTRDWSDITPDRAQVFYDIGIHDIDLTIVELDGVYYGFHKPGGVGDLMGNRLSTSRTLDPKTNTFAEGAPGKIVLEGQSKPTEGPEVIQLIGQKKWYVYGDPFRHPMEAWETVDFVHFKKIDVKTVPGSKHCSMLPITETELRRLRAEYPESAAAEARWPRDKAWRWYRGQAWPCGFNYVPADAISYTEMWMGYSFDPKRIDRELRLAQDVGFNCLRVVLPFVVWEGDPAAFKKRLDAFLAICERRGLRVMFTLFDDCVFGPIKDPVFGKQPDVVAGWYANGWTPSPGHGIVRDSREWPRLKKYVQDVVGTFKADRRVWVWDLYNEPTNGGLGNVSVPLVEKVFDWAREAGPAQPLTVGQWNGNDTLNDVIFRRSDIITFHDYGGAEHLRRHIEELKKHARPVINTEWLNRGRGSVVKTCLPVFLAEKVGCMHWGLVNGKTQTNLNWGHRPGQPDPPVWQHDVFRGNHEPYAPEELKLFRQSLQAARRNR